MTAILISLALRSVVLLVIGAIGAFALGKHSASSRNAVWRLAILGLFLMPLMLVRLPSWEVSVERIPVVNSAVHFVQVAPTEVSKAPRPVENLAGATVSELPPRNVRSVSIDWANALLMFWGAMSAISIIPLLLGMVALYRTIRRSRIQEQHELARLALALGIRRRVTLRVSDDIRTPATAGYFRPIVLLPCEMLDWDFERLEMVLRHELAHVKRNDWIVRIAAHIACVLYAPNPLVWYASARLRAESEAACDDLVIAGGVNAKAYAKELLTVARNVRRSNLGVATVGMAHRTKVESRLRAIVDPVRRRGSISRRAAASLAACGLLSVGVIASVRFVAIQSKKAKVAEPAAEQFFPWQELRDDVSDHPTVPHVQKGSKRSLSTYRPPSSRITVATDGVAHLPNGVTVSLLGVAPSSTDSPIWTNANREVRTVPMSRTRSSYSFRASGQYFPAVTRDFFYSIEASKPTTASTMGYMVKPIVSPFHFNAGIYQEAGMDVPSNSFRVGSSSLHTVLLEFPGIPKYAQISYRFGVATGEWRSVLDVANPLSSLESHHKAMYSKISGAMFKTDPNTPCLQFMGPKGEAVGEGIEFDGSEASSTLVARRTLALDADGNLIRGHSIQLGVYSFDAAEIRRCKHFIVQEREYQWAEFRDVPIRPTLEVDARKAAGAIFRGNATGIAPGYEKAISGIGTVAILDVATARKQGQSWTDDDQPRWRGDGKVLADPSTLARPTAMPSPQAAGAPTTIRLTYKGAGWHSVNTKLRIEGEPGNSLPIQFDVSSAITRVLPVASKEVTVALDIADGPWQLVDSIPVDIKRLPDIPETRSTMVRSGLLLFDEESPWYIQLDEPTDMRTNLNKMTHHFKDAPSNCARRFVAVRKDGSEVQLPSASTVYLPARHGEDASAEMFAKMQNRPFVLASELKEIRVEARPVRQTVRFEHVAVKPKI